MKDENSEKLQALLDEEVSGPLGDKIMSLVDDIVDDESRTAYDQGATDERSGVESDTWDRA